MRTEKAIAAFLGNLVGLSDGTMTVYQSQLARFAVAFPELPTDRDVVDLFVTESSSSRESRTMMRRTVGRMYEYLVAQGEIAESPVTRLKVGRPKKSVRVRVDQLDAVSRLRLIRDSAGHVTGIDLTTELRVTGDDGKTSVVGTVGPIRCANVQDWKPPPSDDPPADS